MQSLLALNPSCSCSIVAPCNSVFSTSALLRPLIINSEVYGRHLGARNQPERRRAVVLDARRGEFRRNAEPECSESHGGVQQDGKHCFLNETKLRISDAPFRDRDRAERGYVEPFVQERVKDDLVRRYWLDEHSGDVRIEEVNISSSHKSRTSDSTEAPLLGIPLPKTVTDFIFPGGFPDTVSSDYLEYMLWQFPTNVTGWICSTLVTSSLFKAVGVGIDAGYAAAAAATIKWVSKDGLGALGLVLIGGRFGSIFDEDPKQWRLYADFVGSAGSIFELCTPLVPDQFLLLGSLGYLFKAVAKGLKDPSFRVIQNHFAIAENVGDVSAKMRNNVTYHKEEVWEVSAKLLGLSVAVLLLGMPGLSSSYMKLVLVWASLRSLHLWLRYQSLAAVQFPTINYRRAAVLIESHLQGYALPGCKACNKRENLLIWWEVVSPRVRIGCSLKDILESAPSAPEVNSNEVQDLLELYAHEDYILVLHPSPLQHLEARVLAKEGATSTAILRSLWQAYWLLLPSVATCRSPSISEKWTSAPLTSGTKPFRVGSLKEQLSNLTVSLDALDSHFDSFLEELEGSGWDLDKIVLKYPSNAPVIVME